MQVNLSGHHVEITPPLRNYVEKKIARILRHCDRVIDVHCTLTVEKLRHEAETTIRLSGTTVHARPPSTTTCTPPSTSWRTSSTSRCAATRKSTATRRRRDTVTEPGFHPDGGPRIRRQSGLLGVLRRGGGVRCD